MRSVTEYCNGKFIVSVIFSCRGSFVASVYKTFISIAAFLWCVSDCTCPAYYVVEIIIGPFMTSKSCACRRLEPVTSVVCIDFIIFLCFCTCFGTVCFLSNVAADIIFVCKAEPGFCSSLHLLYMTELRTPYQLVIYLCVYKSVVKVQ